MKNNFIFTTLMVCLFAKVNAQNIQFFTTTEARQGSAIISVFAQSSSAPENMIGFDLEYHYDVNYATISSIDFSPIFKVLGWGDQEYSNIIFENVKIPITTSSFVGCSLMDKIAPLTGTTFTDKPTLLFKMTFFTKGSTSTFGYLASTSISPAIAYTSAGYIGHAIVALPNRVDENSSDISLDASLNETAGLNISSFVSVKVSPNPASDFVNIQFETQDESEVLIRLSDMNGRVLLVSDMTTTKGVNSTKMDLSAYAPGIYWLTFKTANETVSHKIVRS